jgi:hypothetical protein
MREEERKTFAMMALTLVLVERWVTKRRSWELIQEMMSEHIAGDASGSNTHGYAMRMRRMFYAFVDLLQPRSPSAEYSAGCVSTLGSPTLSPLRG